MMWVPSRALELVVLRVGLWDRVPGLGCGVLGAHMFGHHSWKTVTSTQSRESGWHRERRIKRRVERRKLEPGKG